MHLLRQLVYRLTVALKVFQKQGLRAGLAELGHTALRILYQRAEYTVMANVLPDQVPLPHPRPGLVIRQATTREEIASLSSIADLADMARFYKMFKNGNIAFIAFQNDQPVGYGWISKDINRSVNRVVPPPLCPGDAYLHDLFVSPPYRGQKIGRGLVSHRLRFLREHGYKRAIIVVLKDNMPALKIHEKMRYKRVGEMSHSRFLFWDRFTYNASEYRI